MHILNRYRWNIAAWTVVVLAVAFVLVQTDYNPPRYLSWVFAEQLTGGSYHRVPCKKWPTVKEAERIMEEQVDIVRRLDSVNRGAPDMHLATGSGCPGKAELRMYFGGISEKKRMQEIIGDKRWFFGIPYSLSNV